MTLNEHVHGGQATADGAAASAATTAAWRVLPSIVATVVAVGATCPHALVPLPCTKQQAST